MAACINKIDHTLNQYWGGYTTKVRAVFKRILILVKKILQHVTPLIVSRTIKAINFTYILDIPIGIRDIVDEGKALLQTKDKTSKFISISDFFANGLDLIDSAGTFFGNILDSNKSILLKLYESYDVSIGFSVVVLSIASRITKIYRACCVKHDLNTGPIYDKRIYILKSKDSPEHQIFIKTFGQAGLKELESEVSNHSGFDKVNLMANRKILAFSMELIGNFLMLGLFIFSPILGNALALSSKILSLTLKVFEDSNINKHFIP